MEPVQIHVKPAGAAPVRKPTQRREFLAIEGEYVPRDAYWLRRLRDGDVVEVDPPSPPKAAPKPVVKQS